MNGNKTMNDKKFWLDVGMKLSEALSVKESFD